MHPILLVRCRVFPSVVKVIDADLMLRLEDTAARRIADDDAGLLEAEAARLLAAQADKERKRDVAKGRKPSSVPSGLPSRRASQVAKASALFLRGKRGSGKGAQLKPSVRRGSNASTSSSSTDRKGGRKPQRDPETSGGAGGSGKSPMKRVGIVAIAGAALIAGNTMLIKLPDRPRSPSPVRQARASKGTYPVRVPLVRQRGKKEKAHPSSGTPRNARTTARNSIKSTTQPSILQTLVTVEDVDDGPPFGATLGKSPLGKSTARRSQKPADYVGGSEASGAASEVQQSAIRPRRQSLSSSSFGVGSDGRASKSPDEDRAEGLAHRKNMRRIMSLQRACNHDRAGDSPAPPKTWQTAPHLKQQVGSDVADCLKQLDRMSESNHNFKDDPDPDPRQTVASTRSPPKLCITEGTTGSHATSGDGDDRDIAKLALGGSQLSWYTRFNSAWPKCTAQPCVACAFTSGIYGFGSCDKVVPNADRSVRTSTTSAIKTMAEAERIELVDHARRFAQKASKIAADPSGATMQKIQAIVWVDLKTRNKADRGWTGAPCVSLGQLDDAAHVGADDGDSSADNKRRSTGAAKSPRDIDGKQLPTATNGKSTGRSPAATPPAERNTGAKTPLGGGGGGGGANTADPGCAPADEGAAAAPVDQAIREHHRLDGFAMSIDYRDLTVTAAACDAHTLQDNIIAHHCITIRKAVALEGLAKAADVARAKQERQSKKRYASGVTGSPVGEPNVDGQTSARTSPMRTPVAKGKGGSPPRIALAPDDEAGHDGAALSDNNSDTTLPPRPDGRAGIPVGVDGKPAPQFTGFTGLPTSTLRDTNQVWVDPASVSLVSERNLYSVQHEHLTPAWTISPEDYFHNRHPARQTEIDWACGQSLLKCCAKNHSNAIATPMPSEYRSEDYQIGSTAVEFCRLSGGSGTLRWPSGRLALCISNTPLGKYSWVFADTDEKRMLLSFSPVGHGLVIWNTGGRCTTRLQFTLAGGCAWKEDGQKECEWDWASAPRLFPVPLCNGMTLHITSRSNVVLEYSRSGRTFELNLATSRMGVEPPAAPAETSKVLQTARAAMADVVKRANATLEQMHEKLLILASGDTQPGSNWANDSAAGRSSSYGALPAVCGGRSNPGAPERLLEGSTHTSLFGYDDSDTALNFLKRSKLDHITLPWETPARVTPPTQPRSGSPRKGVARCPPTESLTNASPEKMVSWRRQGLPTVPDELYDAFIGKASATRVVVVATLDESVQLQPTRSALLRIHLRRLRGHNAGSGVPPGVPLGPDGFWLLGSKIGSASDLLVRRHNIDAGALLFYGNGRLVHMKLVTDPAAFGVAELERCVEEARDRIGKIEFPDNFQFKP